MQFLTKIMAISLALVVFSQFVKAMDYREPYNESRGIYNRSWQKPAEDGKVLLAIIDRERAAHATTANLFNRERVAHAETASMLRGTFQISQEWMSLCLSQAETIAKLVERIKILEEAIDTLTTFSGIWSESIFSRSPSLERTKVTDIADEIRTRKRMQEKEFLKRLEQKDRAILQKEAEIAALRSALGMKSARVPFSPVTTAVSTSCLLDDDNQVPELKLSH